MCSIKTPIYITFFFSVSLSHSDDKLIDGIFVPTVSLMNFVVNILLLCAEYIILPIVQDHHYTQPSMETSGSVGLSVYSVWVAEVITDRVYFAS